MVQYVTNNRINKNISWGGMMLNNFIKNQYIRENLIFILISFVVILHEPAIVSAAGNPYNPVNFTESLNLSRGNLSPVSEDSFYLSHEDSCSFVVKEFAWEPESCGAIENLFARLVPGSDTTIVQKPNTDGFVKFDDWDKSNSKDEIQNIWDEMVKGSIDQSKKLGITINPIKWVVYPHLDKQSNFMYYAVLMQWGDSNVINVKATLFDRYGYVAFIIVPDSTDYNEAKLTQIVENTLNTYTSSSKQSYSEFTSGDKIAAAGALGVLATLVGVKYGKAIASGFIAMLLIFAKKLWFIVFLPLIWLWNKIFKKKSD
jgi:hypothetical protein